MSNLVDTVPVGIGFEGIVLESSVLGLVLLLVLFVLDGSLVVSHFLDFSESLFVACSIPVSLGLVLGLSLT